MEKKLAMRWVKALRSGKYKQGTDLLCDAKNQYCCLGVLARVKGIKKSSIIGVQDLLDFDDDNNLYCGLNDDLGRAFEGSIKIAGVTYGSLSSANDCGVSFKCIATWIEKNYKKL